VSAYAVLEAFTASALNWNVAPCTGLFEEVEALVDFESFLDIDAQNEIRAIAYDEVHALILQRLKARNHFLH
jgi:hypothetical protein